MAELKASDKEKQPQGSEKESFSEMNEFEHNRNPVASAQKQMASQETAGVLEQE